jgi:hypothetical protein
MKYRESFKWDTFKSGFQERLGHGLGSVKKSAIVVKTKTSEVTQSGIRQLVALEKKSKEQLKKMFKRSA